MATRKPDEPTPPADSEPKPKPKKLSADEARQQMLAGDLSWNDYVRAVQAADG